MKRLLYSLLIFIGMVVLSVVSSLGVYYYKGGPCPIFAKDTANVHATIVEQVTNPQMYTAEDVHQLRNDCIKQRFIDSVFLAIPPNILSNIAQVVIGQKSFATKEDIVLEFQKNGETVYKYITHKDNDKPREPEPEVVIKLPPGKELDTIVNGTHVKLIKETNSNE